MERKALVTLCMVMLLVGVLPATVSAEPAQVDYIAFDIGPQLRAWEPTADRILGAPSTSSSGAGSSSAEMADYEPGDSIIWLALDDYTGYYYFKTYTLAAMGENAEVWVSEDIDFPASDSRNPVVITQAQIDYLLSEVDANIYETLTTAFTEPDYHDGSLSLLEAWGYVPPGYYSGEKLVILVDNIRDDNYYDETYPIYIAGFYSPTFEAYFDRNVISIDTWDWENRIGPDADKPYLYEGLIAHEFQHLLHDDADSDEELFVNEGLSDFAEFLCGYGHPQSHLFGDYGLASHPENSLVVWEDQGDLEILADYGIAYMWTLYLYEHLGLGFLQAMFMNTDNGISGVDSTLATMMYETSFAEIYHYFSVALLIDSPFADWLYGFQTIEFTLDIGTPAAPNTEAFDTPGAPPWGSDYIWINEDPNEKDKLLFDGEEQTILPTAWTSDGDVLWSGAGDLIDNWAIFEATGGGTLTFDTYWDIEDYWDFGFVQVSSDGGYTWASLENAYTTYDYDPSALPKAINNLPGLTGWSTDWLTIEYDLSAYSGDILIAFRYVTDWATAYEGWFIDNVYVDSTLISDGSDASVFMDITEVMPIENDFTVSVVAIKDMGNGNQHKVMTMDLDDMTEEGMLELNSVLKWSNTAVMVVTFDAPEGFVFYADYTFEITDKVTGKDK
jgi:immune inhibitor A